jgi:hypothetical protein
MYNFFVFEREISIAIREMEDHKKIEWTKKDFLNWFLDINIYHGITSVTLRGLLEVEARAVFNQIDDDGNGVLDSYEIATKFIQYMPKNLDSTTKVINIKFYLFLILEL